MEICNESEQLVFIFKQLMESVLAEHNLDKALSFIADDIIGIGMGAQGVVTSKEDAKKIICSSKTDTNTESTSLEYLNIQVRCYDGNCGTVCGVIKVIVVDNEKVLTSTIGQFASLHKRDGKWMVYALQATPIFEKIDELEAYPIKFAENVLDAYRRQEQIAKNAQSDNAAVYLVNYTKGIFENAVLKNKFVVRVEKGDPYEEVIFNQARKHLRGQDHFNFISTFSLGNVLTAYQNGQTQLTLEYEMVYSLHKTIWMRTIVKLYFDKSNNSLMGYLYVIDIDKEKRRELALQRYAEQDSMTGLYNKKYSEIKITEKLASTAPFHPGAFLMIDLDYFKNINDTYGHQEGDRIIKRTAKCMQKVTGSDDIVGRIGGDEFCIFLENADSYDSVIAKADYLCKCVKEIIPSGEIGISCSIGIVFCDDSDMTFSEVYRRADQALYQRKRNGRNGYAIYNNED